MQDYCNRMSAPELHRRRGNQEEDFSDQVRTSQGTKWRSLSLCPSTFMNSDEWSDWQALHIQPKARSKSLLLVNDLVDLDDDESFEHCAIDHSTNHSNTHYLDDTLIADKLHARISSVARGVHPGRPYKDRTAICPPSSSFQPHDIRYVTLTIHPFSSSNSSRNLNRDRSGLRLSRTTQYRKDHPGLPVSPTDLIK
jgi:hypothetical protein